MEKPALHNILCSILGAPFPDGEDHCYFEPPNNMAIEYPCIVYHRSNGYDVFADNLHYMNSIRYTVTIIDEDPDSKIPARLEKLPYCNSDRIFSSDNLSHFVYTLYYSGPRIKEENNNE